MWINLGIFIYIGSVRPFDTRQKNYIEMTNEIFIMMVTGHDMFFTDIIPTRATQFKIGWSMILFMVFNAAINFSIVIKMMLWNLYLIFLKWYRRLRKCLDKNYKQDEDEDS